MTLTLTILYRYYAHSMDVVWHLLEDVGSLAQGHTRPMPQDKCTRSLRWEPTTSPTVGFLHQFTTPWDWFPVLLVGRTLSMTYYLLVTLCQGHVQSEGLKADLSLDVMYT